MLPTAPARESDQGSLRTCTRHAVAKAIVDGFQDSIFHHLEVDLDQETVTQALISMDQGREMEGMWPERNSAVIQSKALVKLSLFCT